MNIELCCCSGGMAEGFRQAGIDFHMAFDQDDDACASYATNLGHRPIQVDIRELLRMMEEGWSPGPVELLVADPPCTPWSVAGRRKGLDDERDLLSVVCRIIELLEPRAWLIANVPGLDHEPNDGAVKSTIGGLRGWCVDYTRLDAASFGVPQHRVRPFWYGHRPHTPCIVWPSPTHGPATNQQCITGVEPIRPWVTVRDALGHLPPEELGRVKTLKLGKTGDHRPSRPDEPARTLTANNLGDGSLLAPKHRPSHPDEPARTLTTSPQCDGALLAPQHEARMKNWHCPSKPDVPSKAITASEAGNGGMAVEWPWDRPSTTVTTRPTQRPPGRHEPGVSYAHRCVVLSERARAILQGFPDGWTFAGTTKRSRGAQIGMAMPPPLAAAVARAIAEQMGSVRKMEVCNG